jgi:hypothetical protein
MCLFESIAANKLFQTIISNEIINKQKLHHVKKIFSFLYIKSLPIKKYVYLLLFFTAVMKVISAEIVLIKRFVKKKSCFNMHFHTQSNSMLVN